MLVRTTKFDIILFFSEVFPNGERAPELSSNPHTLQDTAYSNEVAETPGVISRRDATYHEELHSWFPGTSSTSRSGLSIHLDETMKLLNGMDNKSCDDLIYILRKENVLVKGLWMWVSNI